MAEGVGSVVESENGSFQSQITRRLPRKASRAAMSAWKPLCVKKSPRGDPRAGAAAKRSIQRASKILLMCTVKRRTAAAIAKSAAKELQSLAEFMPNLADTDARTLALRLYYIELADGVSPIRARNKVSQMFLVSVATVKRWSSSWESIGEDALLDHRSEHEERDASLLFGSPALVFELQSWIKNRLKQGGKHKDGYLTIQQLQNYINNVLFNDPDVVSPELLDLHDARYHSRQVSRMTVLRWMHKLGYKWADSSRAPFCDRHKDQDVVTYRNEWVKQMLALKPRLPILSEATGKPEWPNLPAGEKPLLHGNHDECILYPNEGNRFAWVSDDAYHMKPKRDGATIMVSGVSVPCQGWLGLETIEPKSDGTWKHDNVMNNLKKVIDQFEHLYPGCQLLLTYDNAPFHTAVKKGSLSTARMNMTDGGKQPIITQMGWFETFDLATNSMKKVLQQMWYPGQDGTPIAKGALRVCKERGLKGIEKMRLDDLRALLASQPDFASVKPEIQQEAERRGHILLFGPKCHPECMHVEMCWAHVKQYCRQHCGQSITALRTSLQHALSEQHLTVKQHTAFSQHTWMWIEAYSHEADGVAVYEAMKALKKLHRHHRKGIHTSIPLPSSQ